MKHSEEFERYYSKKYNVGMHLIIDSRLRLSGYTHTTRLGQDLDMAFSSWEAAIASAKKRDA